MNVVLFEPAELRGDGSVHISDVRARHLVNVLRVEPGQHVRVGVVDGPLGVGTVTALSDGDVTLQCAFEAETPERPRVDLLLALPRPKVMRRLWAPLAALGVGQIILTNAEKVERNYFDTHVLKPEGYRPLLIEGLQQARDTRVPRVSVHKQFRRLIEDDLEVLFHRGRRIVAHPDAGAPTIGKTLTEGSPEPPYVPLRDRVLLAVGPEGGWNDFELALLATHGFTPVSMGPRTLPTTVACISLLSLAHAAIAR